MGKALSKFYDEPDKHLKIIGVTGTDGKTTMSSIIYQLLNMVDKCGYIGTNGAQCSSFRDKMNYTTPPLKDVYKYLSKFYQDKCNYVSMEASSEGLLTNRLKSLKFDVGIFTNITKEHLDKHKTMENYVAAKSILFKEVKRDGYCIINNDDDYASVIKESCHGTIITYGINNQADIMADNIVIEENKLTFNLHYKDKKYLIESPLSGKFNVYNLMASIITCVLLGFDIKVIIEAVKKIKTIESRIEMLEYNQPFKIVLDYAHTANALGNLLEYINQIKKGKIITVTGAAGGRYDGKRPDMGEKTTSLSDYVIFTTDDPRFEDPNDIIDDLVLNIKANNYERIVDRTQAIHKALSIAKEEDIVVIAGKGRDSYMAVGNDYLPYSDIEAVEKYFLKENI